MSGREAVAGLGLNWTQNPHSLCIVRHEQKVASDPDFLTELLLGKLSNEENTMTAIERDEMKISQAKVSAVNCVQEWIQKLVNLGATPNEIYDTLEQIKQRTIISLCQRKE